MNLAKYLVLIISFTSAPLWASCPETLDHKVQTLVGKRQVHLCQDYLGKVVLIVNTASKCGYTPQFDGLEKLFSKYKARGLVVLGFPSNDFGGQEPGTAKQIKEFCKLTYGVKFPMFSKSHAAQQHASPLFQTLGKLAGEYPAWNFHKYLLDRKGNLVASYPSKIEPLGTQLESKIVSLLQK
jgi:glutathione peroxidase